MADIAPATADLLFFGLDHGIDSIKDGSGPLIPFVIAEVAGQRQLTRFAAETLEESVHLAISHLRSTPPHGEDRSVLVYDGFLTTGGERRDAIFAESIDGSGNVTILAQRYKPRKLLSKFETYGNAALVPGPGKL